MRESPLPTEDEIKEVLGVNYLDDDDDIELFRIATAEALKWVVEDLREKADILFKAANNEDISYSVRGDKILVCNHLKLLADAYEAKLKEIEDEQKQELNEKIARWCGFYTSKSKIAPWWLRPDKRIWGPNPPDFLDPIKGLGLMDKYPIAKLREKYHGLQIRIAYMGSGGKIIIEQRKNCKDIVLVSKEFVDGYVSTTTALALALGKLIEEENDKASMAKEDTETKEAHRLPKY